MTDPLGQSQVLPYLKGLSSFGYNIHLISFEKSEKFKRYKKTIQSICDEGGITWHPQDYSNEGGLKKTIRQVIKMKRVARYLHKKHHFEIIHCRSYISALVGLELKRKHGVKFVFDMRGFWADERIDGGIWSLENPIFKTIYKYFKKKEIQFFNESDYTVSLTENGKNEIISWPKIRNDIKIKVIPCCVDLNLFNPNNIKVEDQITAKEKLKITPENNILGYVGSIGTWYMLSEMLDFFKEYLNHNPNAIFLFVTGEKEETIIKAVKEKNIDPNSIRVKSVLHSEVPLYISLFHKSIFFIRSTYSKKASSPTKQGEIMAMGIPLICNAGVGDTDLVVKKYNAGIVLNEMNEAHYKNAINSESNLDIELIKKGAKEYFSLTEGTQRYLSIYQEIYE
jgi:glycosyltransferase involved in cell wall biosynthesis